MQTTGGPGVVCGQDRRPAETRGELQDPPRRDPDLGTVAHPRDDAPGHERGVVGQVADEQQGIARCANDHRERPCCVSRGRDEDEGAVAEEVVAGREGHEVGLVRRGKRDPLPLETGQGDVAPQVSAQLGSPGLKLAPLRLGHHDPGLPKIREPSDVILVQVGQHHDAHVVGCIAGGPELAPDAVLRRDLEPGEAPIDQPGKPARREVAGIRDRGRILARVEEHQPFAMLDDETVDGSRKAPSPRQQQPDGYGQPAPFSVLRVDPHRAGADRGDGVDRVRAGRCDHDQTVTTDRPPVSSRRAAI